MIHRDGRTNAKVISWKMSGDVQRSVCYPTIHLLHGIPADLFFFGLIKMRFYFTLSIFDTHSNTTKLIPCYLWLVHLD